MQFSDSTSTPLNAFLILVSTIYFCTSITAAVNINSIWKTINRCLPRKEPPLNTTKNLQCQANKFIEFYTSVGIATAVKAQAKEHGLAIQDYSPLSYINTNLIDDVCVQFDVQPVKCGRPRDMIWLRQGF